MKKILIIAGAAALLATPALAASTQHKVRAVQPMDPYAYASVQSPAVWQGDYETIARDPDANVRLSLQRDNPTGAGQ